MIFHQTDILTWLPCSSWFPWMVWLWTDSAVTYWQHRSCAACRSAASCPKAWRRLREPPWFPVTNQQTEDCNQTANNKRKRKTTLSNTSKTGCKLPTTYRSTFMLSCGCFVFSLLMSLWHQQSFIQPFQGILHSSNVSLTLSRYLLCRLWLDIATKLFKY